MNIFQIKVYMIRYMYKNTMAKVDLRRAVNKIKNHGKG